MWKSCISGYKYSSSSRHQIDSQHPHGSSIPGDSSPRGSETQLMTLSVTKYTYGTQTYTQEKHIIKQKITKRKISLSNFTPKMNLQSSLLIFHFKSYFETVSSFLESLIIFKPTSCPPFLPITEGIFYLGSIISEGWEFQVPSQLQSES